MQKSLLDVFRNSKESSGLFFDIDGTLSEIAQTPESAYVDSDIKDLLSLLSQQYKIMGIATGRSMEDAQKMIGIDSLVYIAEHGSETYIYGKYSVHTKYPLRLDDERLRIISCLGARIEQKRYSISFHYRKSPLIKDALHRHVSSLAKHYNLDMMSGNCVYELKHSGAGTKGTRVIEVARDYHLDYVLFSGDDVTDVRSFLEIKSIGGICIGVGSYAGQYADIAVDSVCDMKDVLQYLAQ
jgi:trehalose 6-phosphate phosphatase